MSDSLRPHGPWPARLLRPWDFPGKNTGVGCHFFLPLLPKHNAMCNIIQSCSLFRMPRVCSPHSPLDTLQSTPALIQRSIVVFLECCVPRTTWLSLIELCVDEQSPLYTRNVLALVLFHYPLLFLCIFPQALFFKYFFIYIWLCWVFLAAWVFL